MGSRLLATDVIALALITTCMTTISFDVLGLREHVPVVLFLVTWLCGAARRISGFRQGRRPALKLRGLTLAAGTAPWLGLGWLHFAYSTSSIWIPLEMPPLLFGLGILLAIATLADPFIGRARERAGHAAAPVPLQWTTEALVPMMAIFLLSGSLVIGLFSAVWLVISAAPYMAASLPAVPSRQLDAYSSG